MTTSKVKVQVRVGEHWVPAHLGELTPVEAERLRAAYGADRPATDVQIVPAGGTDG